VRDKCFKACITSPSSSLSGSEQKCLSRCMDRYQEVRYCGPGQLLHVRLLLMHCMALTAAPCIPLHTCHGTG
jgi:hypothetical protein